MNELHWLAATCVLTAFFWLPYVLKRMTVLGVFGAMGNPSPDAELILGWAMRAQAAHKNALENLALFAPLVLAAYSLDASNSTTLIMAKVYFFARLTHFVVYTAGIPVARTLAFVGGWIATLGVASVVLG